MKKNLYSLCCGFAVAALLSFATGRTQAQAISETFNDITTLAGNGWVMTNASVSVGSTNWFQGTNVSAGGPFDAYNGAANAYIGANYNNTGSTGTISNWLMMPNRTLRNGDVLTFYTRKASPDDYADRLQVRLSTNGASTNVGTGTGVGDYTTLLLDINPSLVLGVYPTAWTQYTITLSGLPAPTSGRLAFRYFVTSGGINGANSDYIGIDQVDYTPYVCPTLSVSPSSLSAATAGSSYSASLTQTGALGTPSYAVTAGALPPGLTLSSSGTISGIPTATGTFNFTVTVSDASGCAGSTSYSITVSCPVDGPNFTLTPGVGCSNDGMVTLNGNVPSGGTYSGTGVNGGQFDAASGTQTITYSYTDAYGCSQAVTSTYTINTAPTVTLDPYTAVCDNSGPVTLTGGSPAGGVYNGTNVSGGQFDPSGGSQSITYVYTDGNGCFNGAGQVFTVNAAPAVTLAAFTAVCDNGGVVTLSGGSPAGGAYSGINVNAGSFDPSGGSQAITYTYTDANGCTNSNSQVFTVNAAPAVTLQAFAAVCDNQGPVNLSGGAPQGGTFSGTNVSAGSFDPSAGTQNITYTYTDGNGCTNSNSQVLTVNPSPAVTLAAFTAVCADANTVVLSGGSPAGGTYTGTGVNAGSFDPLAGTQTITYTYTDGNGCTNTDSQVFTVNDLPVVTLAAFTAACNNAAPVTLTEGSPAGGTYSGTGVNAGAFDPSTGTQTITYSYTDGNGCTATDDEVFTVNTAPAVTLGAFTAVCSDAATVTLSGGSPAGGTYTGNGVNAGQFDPSAGTQVVTYTYTDGNGCMGSDDKVFTVNTIPTVTLSAFTAVCEDAADVTLAGAAPAGGTFTGTGVTNGAFDPSSGTQTITYTYTDGNGCTNTANEVFTVNALPTVTLAQFAAVCSNAAHVTLSGGSPAGGTYSGTGVASGMFDPASGTQTITYAYTDGNGCGASATQSISVNTAPTVTLAALASVCNNASPVTLSGGTPAGGTYSGTGVSSGTFNPASGTQTITYTYTDGNGCAGTATQVQDVDTCTGIATVAANLFVVYPNPATNSITVKMPSVTDGFLNVQLVDVMGNVVMADTHAAYFGSYQQTFDISHLAQGIYIVEIHNGTTLSTQKIVKQ